MEQDSPSSAEDLVFSARPSPDTSPSSPSSPSSPQIVPATPSKTLVLASGKLLGVAASSAKPTPSPAAKRRDHGRIAIESTTTSDDDEITEKETRRKHRKRKREPPSTTPAKARRTGRHIVMSDDGSNQASDTGESAKETKLIASQEDSFDLNDFLEELDSTVVGEPTASGARTATGVDDDFLLASAFASDSIGSRLRPRRNGAAVLPPRTKPNHRPVVSSKRRSAENKWSVRRLLADILQDQDEEADAEAENEYDDETLTYLQQETVLRQQRKQGSSDKFDRQAHALDVFPRWPLELPLPDAPQHIDPAVLPSSMLDEETWPIFLHSGEFRRLICTARHVPQALLRWLFHVVALETTNEHVIWAAGKALRATIEPRAAELRFWVASLRDFEDIMQWYGAANLGSVDVRLQAASDAAPPEQRDERFPLANLDRLLDYMSRAVLRRPDKYTKQDLMGLLRWVAVLLQDRRVGSYCYASLRACLCAIFAHAALADLLSSEAEFRAVLETLVVTGHGGHVPNKAVMLSLLPTATSPLILQFRKRAALALLEQHFGAATAAAAIATNAGDSDGGSDARSMDRMATLLDGVEIGPETDYALLSSMIDFIDFATMAMPGPVLRLEAGQRLTVAFKLLNGRIREIQGFNLAITRVKDKLVILSAKLDQFRRLKDYSGGGGGDIERSFFAARESPMAEWNASRAASPTSRVSGQSEDENEDEDSESEDDSDDDEEDE